MRNPNAPRVRLSNLGSVLTGCKTGLLFLTWGLGYYYMGLRVFLRRVLGQYDLALYGTFPKQGDPNVDPKIL